jgi:acyl-coenzyme A thioesterase PaaI-like protein
VFLDAADGRFVASELARGPWDAGAQHGGAPAALLAEAIEGLARLQGMAIARLTFEFLGPVPLEPLSVAAAVTKPGRRVQIADGEITVDGRAALRVRALLMRRGDVDLPGGHPDAEAPPGGGPEKGEVAPFPVHGDTDGFHRTGMEIRFGGMTNYGPGPALAWFRFARPLVDEEAPSPVARVAAAADFGNGVSRVVDFDRFLFVNTDLTIHLHREPQGEWVLLDSRTWLERAGVGLAHSRLHDESGPIGLAAQSLFVDAR